MTSFARAERAALADALLAAGPDAPTLCTGWATRDLAAHVVLRERRPDAAAGIVLKPVAGHTKQVQDRLAGGDYAELVRTLATPPAWLRLTGLDEAMNLVEYFIHLEDVRRAQPDWTPRELPAEMTAALTKRIKGSAKLSTRKFPARITVQPANQTPFTAGSKAAVEEVTVAGDPGELLLFFTGRQAAANVTVTGPEALADRLRGARLGI